MSEQINSGQVEQPETPETSGLLLSVEPLEQRSMKLSAGDDSSDTSNDGGSDTSDDSSDADSSDTSGDDTGTSTDTDLTDALGGSDDSSDSDSSDDSGATEIRIDTKND